METRVETLSPVTRKLFIDLKPEEVNEEYTSIISELKKRVKIPGFRKNKAPVHLVETRYRKEIEQEIIRFVANDKYPVALKETEKELGKIIREEIVDFKLNPDHSVSAGFYVEILPEFQLKEMDNPTLTIPVQEKNLEETAERVLEDLRQQHAQLKPVDKEKAEKNDFIDISLKGNDKDGKTLINNEKLEIELQDDGYFAPVVPEIIGMAVGEEKAFTITYPDDERYGMLKDETVSFTATVNQIMEKTIPELNDDFAKEMGKFDTLTELKADIRQNLTEKYEQAEKSARQRAVMDHLLKTHEFEAPPTLIHEEARKMTENYFSQMARYGIPMEKDEEKIKAIYEQSLKDAEQRVKESILLGRFAELFDVKVEDSEIDDVLKKAAAGFGKNATVKEVRKVFEEQGELDNIKGMVRNDKTFDLLVEKASFEEKDVNHEGHDHEKKPVAEKPSKAKEKTEEKHVDSDGD